MNLERFLLSQIRISTHIILFYLSDLLLLASVIITGLLSDRGLMVSLVFWVLFVLLIIFIILTIFVSGIVKSLADKRVLRAGKEKVLNVTFFGLIEKLNIKEARIYTAAIAKKQAEFDALQSQINPHFLYNTLDAIRGQALIDKVPLIADMTEALAVLFRYSISQKGSMVSLRDEMRNVDKYLMIQQFRFYNKFHIVKELEDETLYDCMVPKLILQPLVENAIYHGLETKKEGGEIRIHIYSTQNRLVIRICDNGLGIPAIRLKEINEALSYSLDREILENQSIRHTGIALVNVNQRIKLLMGNSFGIFLYSTPNYGTDVEVLLPIIREDTVLSDTQGDLFP